MAINRVNLEDVISDAKAALEAGNPDKAIALCHHIFKFYPRCLEASRMLGEAYTEQRLFAEAEQLFVFVLSSDPQDVLGYVDRGFIAYEQGRLDAAILYCERALELDPSIEQLREELLRLYRERKDGNRPQIRMTKVGLANARLRDGLYVQAIEEYTTVLRQTPNRLDVQVGLMEAYWRNRDYNRAEQLAQELIENNAYLVKANLVLWHIYGVRRNQDRAADYLERAHALDPLNLLAERLFEDSPVSNEAMSYISMLGVPAIPRPDSESLAAEVASQKSLIPEWATGRQETDVVLGLRPDLPSAAEEDNNLGLDLFALLSDTERHVAQQQEEEYVDLKAQLTNLQATETELVRLLAKTNSVAEILSVQRELTNVRGEIDRRQGRINYLEKKTSMSSIVINISPVLPASVKNSDAQSWNPLQVLDTAWAGSLKGLQGLYIVAITLGVWLIWLGPLFLIAYFVYRRVTRAKPNRPAATDPTV